MSHITHLYHLSALDYVSAAFLGSPWSPTYTQNMLVADAVTKTGTGTTLIANSLVANYVTALSIRRKMHTAGALFSGRQPIQNALVPGGVTTLFSANYPTAYVSGTTQGADAFGPFNAGQIQSKFGVLIKEIGEFINQNYIPDVLTVAYHYGYPGTATLGMDTTSLPRVRNYFKTSGCLRFMSYGDFPIDNTGTLAIKRGVVDVNGTGFGSASAANWANFDQGLIKEYVGSSFYEYATLDAKGLHPFDGKTVPNMNPTPNTGSYSWLKAPRYDGKVVEVGPLARMVVSYVSDRIAGVAGVQVNDLYTAAGGARIGGSYTIRNGVNAVLNEATLAGPWPNTADVALTTLDLLSSPLGRHAARALEAKFLCDYLANTVAALAADQKTYTYAKIPKTISTGFGLCEAPRGALGHWIKITGRKTAKYQCVVPSTWNFSPKALSATDHGAVEQALMDINLGTDPSQMIINILRVVHPFDCCIACAVHVVNPEGKDIVKFAIGPDGRATNIEVKE